MGTFELAGGRHGHSKGDCSLYGGCEYYPWAGSVVVSPPVREEVSPPLSGPSPTFFCSLLCVVIMHLFVIISASAVILPPAPGAFRRLQSGDILSLVASIIQICSLMLSPAASWAWTGQGVLGRVLHTSRCKRCWEEAYVLLSKASVFLVRFLAISRRVCMNDVWDTKACCSNDYFRSSFRFSTEKAWNSNYDKDSKSSSLHRWPASSNMVDGTSTSQLWVQRNSS